MEPLHPIASSAGAAAPVLAPEQPFPVQPASSSLSAPIDRAQRITAIDTLRGFALLGILLMNIVAMGMYGGAYDDPTVYGGATGANLWVWAVLHVVAEGKMRCLFSLVFGAGIVLLTSRLEQRGANSADVYYRRTLWLMLFGIVHAYLLWLGDILYPYAICALALYPFRKMTPRALLTIGGVLVLLTALSYIGLGFKQQDIIAEGRAAEQLATQGKKLTPEQEEARQEYDHWKHMARPTAAEIEKDKAAWRGNFASVIKARAKWVGMFHSKPYYHPMNWDVWSMMLIGMALVKRGVLNATRSARTYGMMILLGYGIGIPLNAYTAWINIKNHFDPAVHSFANSTYDIGRLSVALGHLGLIMLLCQKGWLRWLTSSLGAAGQMAFSNYIMQSVITAFLFTGYGLKWYGSLQRYQLYYVVAAIWVFQLVVSPIWLRQFRFGPLEWCWRSLTYWQRQPMRL